MSMPDRINNIYPIFQKTYPFSVNGGASNGMVLRGFRNGFFIFWGASVYDGGIYNLSIEETSEPEIEGPVIPLSRLYFPRPIKQTQSEADVLTIVSPGGLINSSGIARLIGIDDFKTDAIRVNIDATSITGGNGAVILVQIWSYPTLSPNNLANLPVLIGG